MKILDQDRRLTVLVVGLYRLATFQHASAQIDHCLSGRTGAGIEGHQQRPAGKIRTTSEGLDLALDRLEQFHPGKAQCRGVGRVRAHDIAGLPDFLDGEGIERMNRAGRRRFGLFVCVQHAITCFVVLNVRLA